MFGRIGSYKALLTQGHRADLINLSCGADNMKFSAQNEE
jgi:hypothetical protein